MALGWCALASASLRETSITIDEFGHLPAGYHLLTTGDFGYCSLNPPLLTGLTALPLLFMDLPDEGRPGPLGRDAGYDFWANGYRFMDLHRADYLAAYTAARHVNLGLAVLLGILLFVWAGQLVPQHPNRAGLLAAGLTWFSPDVLAHARLVTTDLGCALTIALALFAGHALVRRPDALRALGLGVAVGLAMLAKFTAVLLYVVLPLQALLLVRGGSRRVFAAQAAALLVSVVVIDTGYLWHDVGTSIDAPAGAAASRLPAPLPAAFGHALDVQRADAQSGDPSYLLGERYHGGRWNYYLVLLAAKLPLSLLLLALWGIVAGIRQPAARRRDAVLLLLPAAACVAGFSLLSQKQLGIRQILPALPLFWLWVACVLARARWDPPRVAALALLALWLGGALARQYPDYLGQFNAAVGGHSAGHRVALDSNLDWGQDLIRLHRFLDSHGAGRIRLYYFGRVDPALYGIDYEVTPLGPGTSGEPELTAISLSLHGRPYLAYDHGRLVALGPLPWSHAALGEPIAQVGAIRIFRNRALRLTAESPAAR